MNNDTIKMLLQNPVAARELLRCDLQLFIAVFYFYMNRRRFIFKWFHLRIIKKLEKLVFADGKRKNLCITIPPRHGKSEIVKLFLAWTYAVNAQSNNIYTSYSNDLVLKFSAEVRAIIESDLFQVLFGLKVDKSTKAKANWKISEGGELRAASLGGAITGFGAGGSDEFYGGAIVCDDLLKPGAGATKVKREACRVYFTDVLKSRRNNTVNVPFILIMQRVHIADIVGWIKENEPDDWDFVEIKALQDDETAIWEEKMSAAELKSLREKSPDVFYAQYQQNPIIAGGNLIRTEWFRTYNTPPERFDRMFIVADTAFTEKKSGDFSAFLLCGVYGSRIYLLDGYCKRVIFPDLCRDLRLFWLTANDKFKTRVPSIFVENKGSGQSLIQQLRHEGLPVSELYPTYMDKNARREMLGDKYTRFQEMASDLESGYCVIPEYAPWVLEFKTQCEAFTGGAQDEHDDYVDCLIYAMKERAKGINLKPKEIKLGAMGF